MTAPPETHARRYYVLGVLTLVSFFNYMDRSILSVLIEPIKTDLEITDTQVGLLSGFTFAIFYATFGFPLARLADRSSRIRTLSAAIILWSCMTAVSGLARSYLHLLIARIGVAVGEAGGVPASHSLIADYFSRKERAFAISIFQAGGLIGIVIGFVLGGQIAQIWGWRSAFFILGAPGVLVGLLAVSTVREPERLHDRTDPSASVGREHLFSAIGSLLGKTTYRHILLAIALENFVTIGFSTWAAPFFMRVHALTLAQAGLWLGASSGIGSVSGILIGGAVSARLVNRDRRWEVWLPAAAAALALPLYLIILLIPVTNVALSLLFANAFFASFGGGVAIASIQSVSPPQHRALAVALLMFCNALIGLGGGPLFVGMLSDALAPEFGRFSLRYAFLPILFVSIWSITHYMIAGRTFRRDARS